MLPLPTLSHHTLGLGTGTHHSLNHSIQAGSCSHLEIQMPFHLTCIWHTRLVLPVRATDGFFSKLWQSSAQKQQFQTRVSRVASITNFRLMAQLFPRLVRPHIRYAFFCAFEKLYLLFVWRLCFRRSKIGADIGTHFL